MTTTRQPGNPFTRWTKLVTGAVRHLYDESLAAGEARERTCRFPRPAGR